MSTHNTDLGRLAEVATIRSPAPELGPRAAKTIHRILDATRTVFLTKGYAGTTIDEIAKRAEISRASFYTYFPTKRDVLLALGADSASIAEEFVQTFLDQTERLTLEDMRRFVDGYFELLEVHGAFATNWTQAALEDEEIRTAGMRRHLRMCRQFGELVSPPGEGGDLVNRGLAAYALVERGWGFAHLYGEDIDLDAFRQELAAMLYARRTSAADRAPGRKSRRRTTR
jgi:TetR/AcrR family transcriptional regulator